MNTGGKRNLGKKTKWDKGGHIIIVMDIIQNEERCNSQQILINSHSFSEVKKYI